MNGLFDSYRSYRGISIKLRPFHNHLKTCCNSFNPFVVKTVFIGECKSSVDDPACNWVCRILTYGAVCAIVGLQPVQQGGHYIHEILSTQEVR